ncbi:MAG: DNA topoisomerase [Euryarchaeota archaeon]|nr:DNA topoisomerase [Euryarchaeota archaeon]
MTTVVFAEKNKAAAQIARILNGSETKRMSVDGLPVYEFTLRGEHWEIMGLAGHITGYDYSEEYNDWRSVAPRTLLDVEPIKKITKANYASAITKLARGADRIILACDYDREGENIGFEAKDIAAKVSQAPVKRARFSSLSVGEINRAFEALVEPDTNLAMSAEARQLLDLKMGATFTRFVTLAVRERARTKGVLSIGPCQTPTCGFVYERERAIREFISTDFWKIEALFNAKGVDFNGIHRGGNIKDRDTAASIYNQIQNCRTATIQNKTVKESIANPPYPLNTTEYLKRASNYLDISPDQALTVAEQLYLAGLISYPRTETNKYAEDHDFSSILTDMKKSVYAEYAIRILSRSPIAPHNGKKDGHDHPPIHPIKVASPEMVKRTVRLEHAWDVYDLVVRHYLANLMPAAIFEKTRLVVLMKDELFDSTGSVQKDAGWMTVYPFERSRNKTLPGVAINESVDVKKITNTKSQTSPPKRLTEAELLTLMDKHGIGTKATAPSHIETNKKRGYFKTTGKTISMLDTGFSLMDGLGTSVPILIKPDIRSRIEALIQDVEDGNKTLDTALNEGTALIKTMFSQLEKGKNEMVSRLAATIEDEAVEADRKNYVGVCDQCGRSMRIIKTDNGRFVGCSGYPQCRNTYPLPKKGALSVLRSMTCKKGGLVVIKVGNKYHWSVGIGPCFTCESEKECFPPQVVGSCPKCDGDMIVIKTKDSCFLGCTNRCGNTQSYPHKGRVTLLDEQCDSCGWHMVRVKERGKDAREFCVNRSCRARNRKG